MMLTHTHTCINTNMFKHVHVCVHACIHTWSRLDVHVRTTHTHTHKHTRNPIISASTLYTRSHTIPSYSNISLFLSQTHIHTPLYSNMYTPHTHPQAKTEAEVISEREGLELEKIWLIHKNGFTLGNLVSDSPKRTSQYNHYSMVRSQVSTCVHISKSR